MKAVEGDSERCEYSIQAIGDHVKLVVSCKSCDGKASLTERECRNNVIDVLLDEPDPDSLILAGLMETLYEDDGMVLINRMTNIARKAHKFCNRPTGGDVDKCSGCKISPAYIFGKIRKAFKKGFPSLQREMTIQSSGLSPKKQQCRECIESTKSDLKSLASEMDELRSFVLRGAFKIAGIRNAIGVEPARLIMGVKRILLENSSVRPCFSSSWVASVGTGRSDPVVSYEIEGEKIELRHVPVRSGCIYKVSPMEYQLPRSHVKLMDLVLSNLMEHYPENVSLESLEQTRSYVKKEADRLIPELSAEHDIVLGSNREEELENAERLSGIVAKYTCGLGVVEVLLKDDHIQDVYVDAPSSSSYVHVVLSGIDDRVDGKLETNIRLGEEAAESLLSKFRLESGRPFSESSPVLEHNLPSFGSRVTVVGPPLSPKGVAIALRRHSTRPWTLLRLIANKTLSAEAAGLISFLIDGRSTILVAGSRGAGKSSLLGAMMLEFPQSQRILTIEDTLELPTSVMQELGFKVQSLYVQSSLGGKGQMTADEALRVSLRLGESALVLGEVRGQEARTLYEAMRAGTAGSSVMGTFHADSATAVSERVIHDMGISQKSFTATDIVIVCGLTRPGGTQKERRRVVQIAEVVKEDGGFRDLLIFDESQDRLVSGEVDSDRVSRIAKSWGVGIEEVRQNIRLRGSIRELIVRTALEMEKPELLEATWVIRSNSKFRQLVDMNGDLGIVQREWEEWFRKGAGYA